MTFTARRLAAVSIVLLGACSDIPTTPQVSLERATGIGSVQGQDRIDAAFRRVSPEVMGLPGTVFADHDERIGKVVIGIAQMAADGPVRAAMRRLSVAEQDYVVELTEPILNMATLRDVFRPTVAGTQIHFTRFLCTMGFNVEHAGGRSFITNSHCTARQGGVEGTVYFQPSSSIDPTVIATEADDPLYARGGSCPLGRKCRHSDASRAVYSASVASNRGEIAQTTGFNNGSLTVSEKKPVFTITSQDDVTKSFELGTVVNKVGRTTGWTRGQVERTCVDTGVLGSQVVLFCQTFVVDPGGAVVVGAGDSGSPVFTITRRDDVRLIGILWGGSADNRLFVFSPLASIVQELGAVTATR